MMTRKSGWLIQSLGVAPSGPSGPAGPRSDVIDLLTRESDQVVQQAQSVVTQAQNGILGQIKVKSSNGQTKGMYDTSVPELENFEDYAPVGTPSPSGPSGPILSNNKTAPNYLDRRPASGQPIAANALANYKPSQFTSVRTSSYMDCTPSTDLGYFFSQDIAKSRVIDPSEWFPENQK